MTTHATVITPKRRLSSRRYTGGAVMEIVNRVSELAPLGNAASVF
jgi:hypothetical protein